MTLISMCNFMLCNVNNKHVLHLLQENDGLSCPFCRTEIKGTEGVTIFPFEPGRSDPKPLEDAMWRMSGIRAEANTAAHRDMYSTAASSDNSSSEVSSFTVCKGALEALFDLCVVLV